MPIFYFAMPGFYILAVYILAAVLPAWFLLRYIYRHDTVEKEPAGLLASLLLMGVAAALCSGVLEGLGEAVLYRLADPGSPLYTVLLAFFVVSYQIVTTNFFMSIGKAGKSILLSLTRQAIFLIPLLLWLPTWLGLDGLWLSFPASDIMATIVTFLLIRAQFRQLSRARQRCD